MQKYLAVVAKACLAQWQNSLIRSWNVNKYSSIVDFTGNARIPNRKRTVKAIVNCESEKR